MPSRIAMSVTRSRVASRKAPKREATPWWRATTPSIRSKKPPASISTLPQTNSPRAKATAAAKEIRVPATVSPLGFTGRRNRNGSAAWIQASRRSPSTDLITQRPPPQARVFAGPWRLLRLQIPLDRHVLRLRVCDLRGDVGKVRELALELLLRDPAAAADQTSVELEPGGRSAIHEAPSRAGKP